MNIFITIHPTDQTEIAISRWDSTNGTQGRALLLDSSSIHIRNPEQARHMAALLNQIASELEAEENAS